MRRLVRQYGRDAETVFPTGDYHKGGSYGPDVNFPLPIEEQNNPNSAGVSRPESLIADIADIGERARRYHVAPGESPPWEAPPMGRFTPVLVQ